MSLHFIEGGTGVTNFTISERDNYQKAIDKYGDKTLFISDDIMVPERWAPGTGMCLHCTETKDLSEFWKVFNSVKKENLKTCKTCIFVDGGTCSNCAGVDGKTEIGEEFSCANFTS